MSADSYTTPGQAGPFSIPTGNLIGDAWQDGGQRIDVRCPEPLDPGLRIHDGEGEPRERVESRDSRPAARQQRRPVPGAGGLDGGGRGDRGGSGPARAGHEKCAHPAISPRRAS